MEAAKDILMVMNTQQPFCFSLMWDNFPKASDGQDATNTAIKSPQSWEGEAGESWGQSSLQTKPLQSYKMNTALGVY